MQAQHYRVLYYQVLQSQVVLQQNLNDSEFVVFEVPSLRPYEVHIWMTAEGDYKSFISGPVGKIHIAHDAQLLCFQLSSSWE